MMNRIVSAFVLPLIVVASIGLASAGTTVMVTVVGEVEFNQIQDPPLGNVLPGDAATLTFMVDSDLFMDSPNFPTRGYEIAQASFSLNLGAVTEELQDPFPAGQTPYFVIRDNDPAVDGFFVSTNLDFPLGVPLEQTGIFGQFLNNFSVTYTGDPLPSLDIFDALGTYDFTGLTVFNWTIDDGPFNAMGLIFSEMTIEAVMVDDDGDGIMNADDLCPDTVIPEGVPTVRLGVNRWALVDADGLFDTTPPNGVGPGFQFDIEHTGGCSCEQIIEAQGLGKGHEKYGCSISAMMDWVLLVSGAQYTPTSIETEGGIGDTDGETRSLVGLDVSPEINMSKRGGAIRPDRKSEALTPDRIRSGSARR